MLSVMPPSPLSCVTPLVAHAMCHAPHHPHCVSHPLSPMPWLHPLSPVSCVAPLVAHTVCRTPHHPCCVSHPSSPVLCVAPLIAHSTCCTPHHPCHVSCLVWLMAQLVDFRKSQYKIK